jgi:hypothetical protein
MIMRRSIPRPVGPLDPALEEAAARALEQVRGKEQYRPAPRAGNVAAALLRPILREGGAKSLPELKRQWKEIVGDKLAQMTEPEKLSAGSSGRVLTIKVAGPAAPFVQHQVPLILDRCNLAGAKLKSLTIRQGAITRPHGANVRPIRQPLSADQEAQLARDVEHIESPALKSALLRLGRAMRA